MDSEQELKTDPDTDGFDEPEPLLDNDESTSKEITERYGSSNSTPS